MSAELEVVEEVEDDEEQQREAELHRAQDQLEKCLAHKEYMGAAAAQKRIDALMSAVCSKADSSAATATGQETQLATDQAHSSAPSVTGQGLQRVTGPEATSLSVASGAAAECIEKNAEEKEKREAQLRRARHQLKMCLDNADYFAAAAVQEKIDALRGAELKLVEEEEVVEDLSLIHI